jgi:molybdopterin synthase catalytic subunit
MFDTWIEEAKAGVDPKELGMILIHNGVVRATAKTGGPVRGMRLTYDREKLAAAVKAAQAREGIAFVRAWINEGNLTVGDDIMKVLVAGRFRTDVLPALQELLTFLKTEVVKEEEVAE